MSEKIIDTAAQTAAPKTAKKKPLNLHRNSLTLKLLKRQTKKHTKKGSANSLTNLLF